MRRPVDVGRALRIGVVTLAVVLAAAQAVRIETHNPQVAGEVSAPPAVAGLLRRACYDCHSNETVWPWYSQVAPVSWMLARDVREGRDELNFSAWSAYDAKTRGKKLKETADEVAAGEMPPWYYVLMHPEAQLAAAERETLRAWTVEELARLGVVTDTPARP